MSKRRQMIFLIGLTAFTVIYLVWRLGWTIPLDHQPVDIICACILLLTEILGIFEMGIHFLTQYGASQNNRELPKWEEGDLPEVDVLVPTCGEPVELLRRTLSGCLSMEYDKREKIHIWLCDDKNRSEMADLARELAVGYFAREVHEDAKAGNLNAALKRTKSPIVVVFDADMCPKPEFLLRTVPYFLVNHRHKDKRGLNQWMGYVQTPQAFINADLFQRAFVSEEIIPNEQDYFYRSLEIARNKHNAVIFGGSNTVLSRKALESVGGFVTGTLTEDFATGIEIQKQKYETFAIEEELALGLSPETLPSLIRQRIRWARGCIQSGRKTKYLRNKELTFVQKLCCLGAISYWYVPVKRLVYLVAPLLYAVCGVTVMRCDTRQMIIFWLPMYLLATIGIQLFSQKKRTTKWSNIYEICLFPFLLIPVLLETIGITRRHFVVTEKAGMGNQKEWSIWYPLPFLVLIGFSFYGIYRMVRITISEQSGIYLFLLFWLIFNLYQLLFGLFFVLRCTNLPKERKNISFVHDLRYDHAGKTNLLFILLRSVGRKNQERRKK